MNFIPSLVNVVISLNFEAVLLELVSVPIDSLIKKLLIVSFWRTLCYFKSDLENKLINLT